MTFDDIFKNQLAAACCVYTDFKRSPNGSALNFINVWDISRDPILWQGLIGWCTQQIINKDIQHLYALEPRGFHFAGAISTHTQIPFSPIARTINQKSCPCNPLSWLMQILPASGHNKVKQYLDSLLPGNVTVTAATMERKKDHILCLEDIDLDAQRIAIIDDLITSGDVISGAEKLIKKNNGFVCDVISPFIIKSFDAETKLKKKGIHLSYLMSVEDIIERRLQQGLKPTQKRSSKIKFI